MTARENVSFLKMGLAGVLGGLVVVAALGIAFELGCFRALFQVGPGRGGSSIVKVRGGSIHGSMTSDSWTSAGNGGYSANPKGTNDWISTTNFQPVLTNVTGTGGWKIVISDSDGQNEQTDALRFCSDPRSNCPLSLAGNGFVYLFPGRNGSHARLSPDADGKTIRFHDDRCDGVGNGEDPKCDKIVKAYISTANAVLPDGKRELTLDCQDPTDTIAKGCEIDIGH